MYSFLGGSEYPLLPFKSQIFLHLNLGYKEGEVSM